MCPKTKLEKERLLDSGFGRNPPPVCVCVVCVCVCVFPRKQKVGAKIWRERQLPIPKLAHEVFGKKKTKRTVMRPIRLGAGADLLVGRCFAVGDLEVKVLKFKVVREGSYSKPLKDGESTTSRSK